MRIDGHVPFAGGYYSLAEEFIGEEVSVEEGREIIGRDGHVLESHPKITLKGQLTSTKPAHLGPWQRSLSPDSLYRRSALRFGANVEKLVMSVIEQGGGFINTGTIFGILNFDRRYSAKAIDEACGVALELSTPTDQAVKTILKLHDTRTHEEKAALRRKQK